MPFFSARFQLLIASLLSMAIACNRPVGKSGFPKDALVYKPKYSQLFSIAFTPTDTFLILSDPADTAKSLGRFCWGKGSENTNGFERLESRHKFIALSAVFVGMIEALHQEKKIVGVDNGDYITSPRTVRQIQSGYTKSVAPTGSLNNEQVMNMKPDFVIGYFIDQKGKEELLQMERNGISVVFMQNFLETHPLGRAEWVLAFGALTGTWEKAQAQFAEIEEHYLSTQERATKVKFRPSVLCNAPFTGIWDVPSGDSYMSRLIADAGGRYIYSDKRGAGRIPLDIESVYKKAQHVDFWFNPGACRDTGCLLMMDRRLAGFKAFQNHRIYNSTKLQNEKGANAWWEYGVLRPDLALLDIFSILHPELEGSHESVFFEPLK